MKTTLKKILQEFNAERNNKMRGTEFEDYYMLAKRWLSSKDNPIYLQITSKQNFKISFELTLMNLSVPEEKIYDVLRFFSRLNENRVFTKFLVDFEEDNAIRCDLVLLIGEVDDSIPAKYSEKIKDWILRMIGMGFDDIDEIQPYIQRIINGNENPDELWAEFIAKD